MDSNTKLVKVTPKMASDWINGSNSGNRKLREGIAEKYAHDMANDKWTECPVPISFYPDGEIADGQHRLWAVIESGTTQEFFIVHNLSREAGLNIDTGLGRTIVDNARISGVDKDLSNALVSLALFYDAGRPPQRGVSNAERIEIIAKHREPCDWAIKHGPVGRGIRNSTILAAVARAKQASADEDRLIRFCKVLSSGLAEGRDDSACVTLRNYLMSGTYRKHEQRDLFLKAQNAIWYFLKRRPLGVLKTVKDEAFPIKPKNARAKEAA